jgi:hypothetical protein
MCHWYPLTLVWMACPVNPMYIFPCLQKMLHMASVLGQGHSWQEECSWSLPGEMSTISDSSPLMQLKLVWIKGRKVTNVAFSLGGPAWYLRKQRVRWICFVLCFHKRFSGVRSSSAWRPSCLQTALALCDKMDSIADSFVTTGTSSYNLEHRTISGNPTSIYIGKTPKSDFHHSKMFQFWTV